MNDITIERAVFQLENHGYSIDSDEVCIVGGEDPEETIGGIEAVQKPFHIDKTETGWSVRSIPVGQITVRKLFDRLVDAFEFVLNKEHLKDPRS